MKKKTLPVWIACMLAIVAIMSCNSREKTAADIVKMDTIVAAKKEIQTPGWTTNTELIVGMLRAGLKVDGILVTVDSAKITIRPQTFFSAIEIGSPRGSLLLNPGWHGLGDYANVYAEWSDNSGSNVTRYSTEDKANGAMKITEWGDGKVTGTFKIPVVENNALGIPKKRSLEGEFQYLQNR